MGYVQEIRERVQRIWSLAYSTEDSFKGLSDNYSDFGKVDIMGDLAPTYPIQKWKQQLDSRYMMHLNQQSMTKNTDDIPSFLCV